MARRSTHHASCLHLHLAVRLSFLLLASHHLPRCSLTLSTNISRSSAGSTSRVRAPCRPQEAAALLQLKGSFLFPTDPMSFPSDRCESTTTLSSWKPGTDCCRWEGISCHGITGRVTALDLSRPCRLVNIGLHPALFNLTSLRYLNLERMDLSGSQLSELGIERFTKLQVVILNYCNLSGLIPPFFSGLHSLQEIDLSQNMLNGTVSNLSSANSFPLLRILDLSSNMFEGLFPLGITHLKNLRVLDLGSTYLSDSIPHSIGNLSLLMELYLSDNRFSEGLPWELSNLTYLTVLDCGYCGVSGRLPSLTSLTRLEYVSVASNNLTGPVLLRDDGNAYLNLKIVDLSNNSLSGTVSATIFTLPALKELNLQMNNFSGSIEEFHNASCTLTLVDLSSNQLNGTIPTSFLGLTALYSISLDSNYFTGTVNLSNYSRLKNLTKFTASHNCLVSIVGDNHWTASDSSNSSISELAFAFCDLTRLPSVMRHLPQLEWLNLSYNDIGGNIPDWVWRDGSGLLDLSHNMFTEVAQAPAYTSITYIDLSSNRLRGDVPSLLSGDYLDYSNNTFSSMLPSTFLTLYRSANYINLANNELGGTIPYAECDQLYPDYLENGGRLEVLDLSGNNFSGQVPPYLLRGCNDFLEVLNLRGNRLEGTWPDEMGSRGLKAIDLHGNLIQGRLPRWLAHCRKLNRLDVGGNNLVDSFPSWLGNLPHLRVLILRSNQFYGPVTVITDPHTHRKNHSRTCCFSCLQIIDLADNGFTGVLSLELFYSLKTMALQSTTC